MGQNPFNIASAKVEFRPCERHADRWARESLGAPGGAVFFLKPEERFTLDTKWLEKGLWGPYNWPYG